jgi:uncharacterized protein YjbI with pentapeptide repeats
LLRIFVPLPHPNSETLMRKADYFFEQTYSDIAYQKEAVNFNEFEGCIFNRCDFSRCTFLAVTFIDCVFNECIFTGAKINYVALRTVTFNGCEIKEVNFAMCDKLIFDMAFNGCRLDFSKFYTLKIKGTVFTDCSLIAVDFMSADLTEVVFDRCDLYRSEFVKAIANKASFRTSFNYTIDPEKTKIKKAVFSRDGLKGLLAKHEIVVI